MNNELEQYQGTENHLWHKFETAIEERFLSGGTMGKVEKQYQPLADALGFFWQHASSPRVQAMMLLATHPLFAKYPYQTRTKDGEVVIKIVPATKWFYLEFFVHFGCLVFSVKCNERAVFTDGVRFHRKGLAKAEELLAWHGQSHPGEHLTLFDDAQHTVIPDYTMILHAIVARGLEACQSLENAVVTTAEQFEKSSPTLCERLDKQQ